MGSFWQEDEGAGRKMKNTTAFTSLSLYCNLFFILVMKIKLLIMHTLGANGEQEESTEKSQDHFRKF